MKRVILDIDDKYANILSLTLVGLDPKETSATIAVVDINNGDHIAFDSNGDMSQRKFWKEVEE